MLCQKSEVGSQRETIFPFPFLQPKQINLFLRGYLVYYRRSRSMVNRSVTDIPMNLALLKVGKQVSQV